MAPDAQDVAFRRAMDNTDVVLDCVFGALAYFSRSLPSSHAAGLTDGTLAGFSFKPPPRAPFITVLDEFKKTKHPILSVDIPSGWDVESGNADGTGFTPGAADAGHSALVVVLKRVS